MYLGIWSPPAIDSCNHAINVIGYGTENGIDYWLCKSSWSDKWGDKDYIKIKRGYNNIRFPARSVV